jgi:hypothetical protein
MKHAKPAPARRRPAPRTWMRRAVGIARRFARTMAAVAMAAIGLDAVVS